MLSLLQTAILTSRRRVDAFRWTSHRFARPPPRRVGASGARCATGQSDDGGRAPPPTRVRLGHVELDLGALPDARPHLVPRQYLPPPDGRAPALLRHLQWLLAKDALGQDAMLVGPPGAGAHHRRRLALMYAEMTGREAEVLVLSADTTESDLKQRKELVRPPRAGDGAPGGGAARVAFTDQAPVRAALHGRLLVLDGLEKAERNVLPTLNNLLENREMPLEDGRLLVSARRYTELQARGPSAAAGGLLVPTHPRFMVVALATPAPPYPGRGLDPPLRSRFQIRRVDGPTAEELYEELRRSGAVDDRAAATLSAFAAAMESAATDFSSSSSGRTLVFPSNALASAARTLSSFPEEEPRSVLARSYPVAIPDARVEKIFGASNSDASRRAFARACDELGVAEDLTSDSRASNKNDVDNIHVIERSVDDPRLARLSFSPSSSTIELPCGPQQLHGPPRGCVPTSGTRRVLKEMIQEHAAGRDVLLLSPRGEGKSTVAREFASMLGYEAALFNLYRDMTARDLLQRRSTDPNSGDTKWEDSALVKAACSGDVCLLDGVERLDADTFASLRGLLTDREASLPDGSKLVRSDRVPKNLPPSDMIRSVHPSFRVVALASLSKDGARKPWLSDDVMSMLSTLVVPRPSPECMRAILSDANPRCPGSVIDGLLCLRSELTEEVALDCGVQPLSTRNLLRIVRLVRDDGAFDLRSAIRAVLLADLLPPTQRVSLESVLDNAGVLGAVGAKKRDQRPVRHDDIVLDEDEGTVSIGNVTFDRRDARRPEMVPSPQFIDIPNQVQTIKRLLNEIQGGGRACLLLGNQGVGKNKLTDRLCELANLEREYIQLHRDSTIGNLTLAPSLEDGKIVWKDSPLIRAVQRGVALVVDEADKAPLEVVAVLKSLVEDGELLLADGRRISRHGEGDGVITMHKDFVLIVLANRPGFPFHGNDFFREVGDCFSVHVIDNPDLDSELKMLSSYGPDVDEAMLRSIASSFDRLRSLADHGDISYPYSTREAVAVVKHLQKYPEDGIGVALHNILDFDSFDDAQYYMLGEVFNHHGIRMADYSSWRAAQARVKTANNKALAIEYINERGPEGKSSSPPELSMPKQGKWDDKNEAHVGGNQWAGGTGGSDTAGLGGRGGPYRLDRGHKVHQVSDEAKAQVSKEAKRVAKAMSVKALEEKLAEISMSEGEWDSYSRFLEPIRKDVAILRNTLKSVEGKKAERSWIKRQSHGEIDDTKLVDGLAGEKYIYKRRGVDADASKPLQAPKRLRFVVDASASMYRFNGYDGRLNRSLEATLMIMLAFDGMKDRFGYSIVAHSGDSPSIPLVHFGQPPQNEKEMMRILQNVMAHTQYCSSGDFTLEAVDQAIEDTCQNALNLNEEADECIVVAISDANLSRYGIDPRELGKIIAAASEKVTPVKAHAIFIASFGQEAEDIKRSLPAGRGHICMDSSDLPRIVRSILTSSVE